MLAWGLFAVAVVQNSRKWNTDRALRKNGIRQRGEFASVRRMAPTRPSEKVAPRANARTDMPARSAGMRVGDGVSQTGVLSGRRLEGGFV